MGFALHEMYEVSGLVMEDIPYEEYVPSAEELHLMEDSAPFVYATYWEVCVTSISALRSPVLGLDGSDRWPGQITSLMV